MMSDIRLGIALCKIIIAKTKVDLASELSLQYIYETQTVSQNEV